MPLNRTLKTVKMATFMLCVLYQLKNKKQNTRQADWRAVTRGA